METKETTTILNDLIQINNDRIEGYERAIKELKDEDHDLKALFAQMIGESHQYKLTLASEVAASGEDIDTGTTNSGKIYRVWMDVKAAFTGHDRKSILENCEFGEDAAQKAYKMALASDAEMVVQPAIPTPAARAATKSVDSVSTVLSSTVGSA